MEKNYLLPNNRLQFKLFFLLTVLSVLNYNDANGQCTNYQVYESIGTALPTSGGTWAATSMGYSTGNARTGANNLVFNASGDIIRTPQIANPGIFSFWYRRSGNSGGSPQFTIETSPNNTAWTSRGTVTPGAAYAQYTLNIGALSLTNVYVRIRDTRASGTAERYVDDISWTSTTAANNTVIPALANCSQTVTCGTTYSFSDAGTTNDDYNSSSDYTITFTPSLGTSKVQLVFSAFSTENGYDGMVIYNGPNTSSPIIPSGLAAGGGSPANCPADSYYGTTSPGTITSTDATGAITIRFRSDGSTESSGWLASVSCAPPCTTPTAQPTALNLSSVTSTSINGAFTAASPAPSGYLVVRSTSSTPPTLANGTTYAVGHTSLTPGTTYVVQGSAVVSNSVSFSSTGLTGNTLYYYHIFSYNSSCGGAPYYFTTSPLTNSATTCPAAPTAPVNSAVTGSSFTVSWTNSAVGGGAGAINYTLEVYSDLAYTSPIAGSPFALGTAVTYNVTGLNPSATYYYRIKANNGSCDSPYLTGSASTTCSTPTAQPTSLILSSITSTTLSGSFTAASPAPTGYFIVRSTSATPPSPVNGTTYAVGSTAFGANTLVIQGSTVVSSSITFSDSGLTSNTRYYYYIFSYNSACSGAPYYFTVSPLSNSSVTCVGALSSAPVNSAISGSGFTVSWGASPVGGGAAGITYTLEVYTDSGYSTPVSGSPFSLGATTYSVSGLTGGTIYYYRVKASNGCDSAYQTGSVTTSLTNDNCSGAVLLTVNPNSACTISTTGTSSGATQSQPACSGTADDDVWFKFVATGPSHTITVTQGTLNNAVLEVFSGTCAGLTSLGCVNANSPANSSPETTTLTGLTSGVTYFVRVHSQNNTVGSTGTFTICVTTPIPPVNNQCANAINLPCGTSNLAGTTSLAANYAHGTGCLMSNYGVWYSFAGDGNSSTISVTTTNNDVELSISSGSCGSLTNIACQDSVLSNGTESYTFTTAIGVTYYVYIANWYTAGTSTDTGSFTISRTCIVPYNPCTSITNIASCGVSTTTTIASGTGGYNPSSCGWSTPGIEKIYTFTPASTGNFTIAQSSSFTYIDYQFKPVSAGCNSTGWTCIDAMSGGITSSSFTMTAGVQYYILLDPESSSGGNVTFTITCPTPPLANDEPCNAIPLTVSTTCSYSNYTNATAGASGGVPDPGCGGYSGGDVWFSAVVPATGEIDVDLQTGVMTDSGMAFYSGTCGSLTLLECDDDDSSNGSMSYISMNGLTPGQTIYIRVWEYGNNNNGTFGICATTPSCPSPADLYANILSNTSVTVNWTASTPPASGGYQYYINTTGTAPTSATSPTGSTSAGVISVTLNSLTPGQKYYFWIRSNCGGSDVSAWFGPTNYTPCNVGTGFGTTTLSCPSVLTGDPGQNGADPAALSCQALTCVNLEANYLQLNQPTDYTVSSIPYSIPYQFTCLQNPVSVNIDDVWSSTINLPFNFCFYGNNYNKCLIGSNGVITFDTTSYSPGGRNEWQFNSNLPDVSLFKNTIFGVYQDIDPSKGGQVGWELITLNTGCRALVASWNDIPMFSSTCNSQLYTGMIVLYENTNVIEVYIKNKTICGSWNNGNAIVGIQNSTGTAAVVAPDRNGLSTNWAASGEAWRFTPSGPSLTTVQWYQGNSVATGTPITGATSNIVSVCPTVTTSYTAEVTYALCTGTIKYEDTSIVTVNGNKIWNGSVDTNWNVANNWTPSGVPTSANCVVIPQLPAGNTKYPILSAAPNGVGYNLNVNANASLTLNSNQNLTITDAVTTAGTFTINNNASLIQINNVLNSGNIIYKRISPGVRTVDYVYWGSPVDNFTMANLVAPYSFGAMFHWNTTAPNNNGGQGIWQYFSGNMVPGKGYIARSPGAAPFNNTTTNPLSATFIGVPNNGNITVPLERGSDEDTTYHTGTNLTQVTNYSDNWNLLGNPYPSAIRGSQFLFDNNTKIEGNLRLWTHGTLPSVITPSPFYGSYLSNYTPGDYLEYNFSGSSCCPTAPSDLFIGAGQGFFVQMVDGPPVAAVDGITVAFNNNLRSATYSNSTFYKTQNATASTPSIDVDAIERNRIWLDLINPNGQTSRILFGYIENATNQRDSFYDCVTQNTGGTLIYSMVGDTKFSIQGRALPFEITDEVPLGFNAPAQGTYKIGIAAVDGFFDSQNIYLKDNLLNIIHNLKADPYVFTTTSGEKNDRFKVIYIDNTLGTPTHTVNGNSIKVITNHQLSVISSNLAMESIDVYNLLGQKLDTYDNINSDALVLSNLNKQNATLLLKIRLQTGEIVTRKVNY